MNRAIIDPIKLLSQPKEFLITDLLEHVMSLSDFHLSTLVEPEEGIYLQNSLKPLMHSGRDYYLKSSYMGKKLGPIDVFIANEDIVDKDCNTVVTEEFLKTRRKYLTNGPNLPVTGLQFAELMVKDHLHRVAPYSRHSRGFNQYVFVKDEFSYLVDDDWFEEAFTKLIEEVDNFVKEDNWFMFNVRLAGTNLIVEKLIDYRIYMYHVKEYEDYLQETGEPF